MFNLFKQEPPYDQSEIAEQVRIISELQGQLNKATKGQYERARVAIDTAQEVLLFMQDENKDYYDRKRSSRTHA